MTNQQNNQTDTDITDVNPSVSFVNAILWILGLSSIVLATLVGQFAGYWQALNNVWMQIGVSIALVVLGIILLLLTTQGRGFFKLIKDVKVELRRITWPGKKETTEYTWKVLVGIIIAAILIFALDSIASILVKPFIG